MKEKKSSLHFAGRTHSKQGIKSTVIGGIAWLVFLALAVYSSVTGGNATMVAGVIGILDAVFAAVGGYFGIQGLYERDVFYVMPVTGIALNAVLFIVYFSLYFMGVAMS